MHLHLFASTVCFTVKRSVCVFLLTQASSLNTSTKMGKIFDMLCFRTMAIKSVLIKSHCALYSVQNGGQYIFTVAKRLDVKTMFGLTSFHDCAQKSAKLVLLFFIDSI